MVNGNPTGNKSKSRPPKRKDTSEAQRESDDLIPLETNNQTSTPMINNTESTIDKSLEDFPALPSTQQHQCKRAKSSNTGTAASTQRARNNSAKAIGRGSKTVTTTMATISKHQEGGNNIHQEKNQTPTHTCTNNDQTTVSSSTPTSKTTLLSVKIITTLHLHYININLVYYKLGIQHTPSHIQVIRTGRMDPLLYHNKIYGNTLFKLIK